MNYLNANNSHIIDGIIEDYFLGASVESNWNCLYGLYQSNISEVKLETKRCSELLNNLFKQCKKFQVRITAKEECQQVSNYIICDALIIRKMGGGFIYACMK